MDNEKLLRRLEAFDPELSDLLLSALNRQLTTLSLIPTANAVSPFSAYLKGSVLGNDFLDHHALERYSRLEQMAARRACQLFHADHAIVRIGNPVAAGRVVFYTLAQPDSKILSFNHRKQEICTGDWMTYDFHKFCLEPDSLSIDYDKLAAQAQELHPRLLICSPVNYPRNINYARMRQIADDCGAFLWADLGQNAGLAAAGLMSSPVPYADVVTFAASDALHGPQNGIILSTEKLSEWLDQAVLQTGHASLKKNVLAALAITFREAGGEEFHDYCEQTINGARALETGLRDAGVETLCGPTENHLVLAKLNDGQDGQAIASTLAETGLMVKPEKLMTSDDNRDYSVLRLSSLDPTTRGLKENDLTKLGRALGTCLRSDMNDYSLNKLSQTISKLAADLPLFSEEWLPDAEANTDNDSNLMEQMMLYWNT